MLPYIQGRPESVPAEYRVGYEVILDRVFDRAGEIGFLTIDESLAREGSPHRGARARFGRALHTEAGMLPDKQYYWGSTRWGDNPDVKLDHDLQVLLANSLDKSCAIWDVQRSTTSADGDIGDLANQYPYTDAILMGAGEVHKIGILTPHESLPVSRDTKRQFLRIVGSGVHGREPYFTKNPLVPL
jgi:hypothetical protein